MVKWTTSKITKKYNEDPELQKQVLDLMYVFELRNEKNDSMAHSLHRKIDFKDINIPIRREFVYAILYKVLINKIKWSTAELLYSKKMPKLINWIIESKKNIKSVVDIPYDKIPKTVRPLKKTIEDYFTKTDPLKCDRWRIEMFNLPYYRFHQQTQTKTFSFNRKMTEYNKILLKKYLLYLINNTEVSISTIASRKGYIASYLSYLDDINAEDISVADFEAAIYNYKGRKEKIKNTSFNTYLFSIKSFYETGQKEFGWKIPYIYWHQYTYSTSYNMIKTARNLSEHKDLQFIAYLDKLPEEIGLAIQILYHTGMRMSEVLELKTDCLYEDEQGTFVQFYQPKMRKYCINPIPKGLYEKMCTYRKKIISLNRKNKYIFLQSNGRPYNVTLVAKYINKLINEKNLRDADGKLLHFRSHSFRHLFALRLLRNDIPFSTVQKLLHHNSPEMTLYYTQIDEETRKKRYMNFFHQATKGKKELTTQEAKIDDDIVWMRAQISQVLPNGYCTLPVQLGECPHANKCLKCKSFETTPEFLSIFTYQIHKIEQLEKIAKNNSDDKRYINLHEIKTIIEKIIAVLKDGGIYSAK